MSKFTFICEEEAMPFADAVSSKRTVEFKAETISDIVNEFEMFLKGCGFNFEGRLDLVQEEQPLGKIYPKDGHEDDLDDIDSIFSGKKSLIRSDEC